MHTCIYDFLKQFLMLKFQPKKKKNLTPYTE